MKKWNWLGIAGLTLTLLAASAALAGEEGMSHHMKIMVATDGADLVDADISELAVGESKSFVTDSGKTIDVLRTQDGVELYIDGELQDLSFGGGAVHGEHVVVHKDVEVECFSDDESECDQHEFMFVDADGDYSFTTGDTDMKIIAKHVEVICGDDEDCDETAWISEDGELHHLAGEGHKVIRIHRSEEDSD